jgi:hypothetical protein
MEQRKQEENGDRRGSLAGSPGLRRNIPSLLDYCDAPPRVKPRSVRIRWCTRKPSTGPLKGHVVLSYIVVGKPRWTGPPCGLEKLVAIVESMDKIGA